ncbi:uncharacterized protein LOC128724197 [Anopheles nili]|uniref:uncharacterized protein LOC128724197 n=1 Tax=Anopheles nili TaxID=185578 RepID=UPI00237AD029|nr:uncharacterized protein LOC128724197 [Anopheles nili]
MEDVLEENRTCLRERKQDFVVSITIYKARHLRELNSNTFVMVACNGKYKRTRTAYRTGNPYFNDYFSFSLHCSEKKLLTRGVLFGLYRASICTTLNSCVGECYVDLCTIWEQKDHAFFRKWITFVPTDRAASNEIPCGYLMVDVSISSTLEKLPPVIFCVEEYEDIEMNIMLPYKSSNVPRRVRYSFNIFRGEFVSNAEYAIRVSYAGSKVILNSLF